MSHRLLCPFSYVLSADIGFHCLSSLLRDVARGIPILELCVLSFLKGVSFCKSKTGNKMGNLDLTGTLSTLTGERAHVRKELTRKELTKLDKAIAVIRKLAGGNSTPNGHSGRRTLSATARRKIGKAQKLRWAKFKRDKAAKS